MPPITRPTTAEPRANASQPVSVIYDEVMSHDPRQAVDVVFVTLLQHRPSTEDRTFAVQEIRSAESPAAGCGNLIWALLNTREFIFIQ